MPTKPKAKISQDYFRSIIFGVEDALVSTTGVVVGISAGSGNRDLVVLAGVVAVAVEALSMGAGQYVSEKAVHEMEGVKNHKDNLFIGALLMFGAYIISGFIPIIPIFIAGDHYQWYMSVIAALTGLFLLGYIKGSFLGISSRKSAIEMLLIGGAATIIGLLVGIWLKV